MLVDTELWYYRATRRALQEIGINLALDEYLDYMARGQSAWDLAVQAGVSETEVRRHKHNRNE